MTSVWGIKNNTDGSKTLERLSRAFFIFSVQAPDSERVV